MKFIKEYNLFSDDSVIKTKIHIIFADVDDCTDYIEVRKNKVIVNIIPEDFEDMRVDEIRKQLRKLNRLGNNFSYTIQITDRYNGDILIKGSDLSDLIFGKYSDLMFSRLIIEFNILAECSNPECDNILENPDEKCPICGE